MPEPPSWLTWIGISTAVGGFLAWLGVGPLREFCVWLAKRFKEKRLARPHLEIHDHALANYPHDQSEPAFVAIPITNRFDNTFEQVSVRLVLTRQNPDLEINIPRATVYFIDRHSSNKIKGAVGTLRDGDTIRVITSVYEDFECSYALKENGHKVALAEGKWTCELTVFSANKEIAHRTFKTKLRYPGIPSFTEYRSALGRVFFP